MQNSSLPPQDGVGGSGGPRNKRADSGLTDIREARLNDMAVRRGWIKPQRWPTRETTEEFQERVASGGASLIDKAILSTHKLLMNGDDRAKGIAIRSVIAMEAQNQSDEHREEGAGVAQLPAGTTYTPDQIVSAMDDTIPASPEENDPDADFDEPTDGATDAGVDQAEVPPATGEAVANQGPVPSGGGGPPVRQD